MARPELGTLAKGDVVLMRSRSSYTGDSRAPREMIVVTLGPRWVGIVDPKWAGTPYERSHIRRFLLRDQREGEPARRVGYGTSFATREQHEYDVHLERAERYLRDEVGIEVRRGSPFEGDEGALRLASLLSAAESSWRKP